MAYELLVDCLNEILEYLEDDKPSLHSCLLVNRLWCKVAVRILWRNVWNYSTMNYRTLIACLSNESKEILYENGITISTPNSKPPMFNYPAFCKVLSIKPVNYIIGELLQQLISSQNLNNLDDKKFIVKQEIFKLFMVQISSLKELNVNYSISRIPHIIVTSYPGASDCLKNLSKLECRSNIHP